jgi:RimJ/RimL family protein N-acetyltransferase
MPWGNDHRELEQSIAYCAKSYGRFHAREEFSLGVFERGRERFLGGTGLLVKDAAARVFELGYWIRASAEGKGYVQESARLVTTAAFEHLGANRVVVRCDSTNLRSLRVIQRAGFPLEGKLRRSDLRPDGTLRDVLVHAMVREDFEAARERWSADDRAAAKAARR